MSDIPVPPTHIDDPAGAKARMRERAAKIRRREADNHPDAAEKLAEYCQLLIDRFGRGVYAAYLPIRSEISPLPLIAALHDAGQPTAMPVTPAEGHPLSFRSWAVGDALEDGPYGTRQPPVGDPPVLPNVILAPLLAFDRAGWRLGYGGGFYDRYIARVFKFKKVITVGLAFSFQELKTVPRNKFDQKLDIILTDKGIIK